MLKGFSLVELSIVLVILGLLTGGILAGQSLIRAAELRSISAEYQRYIAATQSFRDKYMAIPGDFKDATLFWGRVGGGTGNCANVETNSDTGLPTCNGDGNGIVNSGTHEMFRFWEHLAAAGLIEGSYTGIRGTGATGPWYHLIGENCPQSKMSNAGWSAVNRGTQLASSGFFDGNYGNSLQFGGQGDSNSETGASLLQPEELWNIDTKMDDGRPAIGKIAVRTRTGCAIAANGAALTTSAADAAKVDANYNLTSTTKACSVIFREAY